MKIDFVRHGQTHLNIAGINNGQSMDDTLTEEGINQARETSAKISKDYTEIYSSDLPRARETAEILNEKFNLLIQYDKRLRERSTGSLTGKTWEEIGQEIKKIDKNQQYNYHEHGGESVDDVKERLFSFINEMRLNKKNEKILVVTHGGIIRLLHHLLNGKNPETIHNASVHEFEFL
jgi:broad specificity phosphatase PhoE